MDSPPQNQMADNDVYNLFMEQLNASDHDDSPSPDVEHLDENKRKKGIFVHIILSEIIRKRIRLWLYMFTQQIFRDDKGGQCKINSQARS